MVEFWSDPIAGEIRDDQGISLHNPDTDVFMEYTLAGAYDSNVALLLTAGGGAGKQPMSKWQKCCARRDFAAEIYRPISPFTTVWCTGFLGRTVNARPTTRFIVPYLTAVGELAQEAGRVDIKIAWEQLCATRVAAAGAEGAALKSVLAAKESLLIRPIMQLMASPHLLSGWLSQNQHAFRFEQGHFEWADNPVEVLADTYHFLRLDWNETLPASSTIWDHDHQILTDAEDFYAELSRRFECDDWAALSRLMTQEAPEGVTGGWTG